MVPARRAPTRHLRLIPPSSLHHACFHSTTATPDLSGLRCLVTGGSRGIGKAIAARLASLSATVTIVGRSASTLQNSLRDIAAGAPPPSRSPTTPPVDAQAKEKHGFVVGDVSSKGFWELLVHGLQLETTASGAQRKYVPRVDVLVNAAGVAQSALLVRQSAVAVEDVVQTNLMGTVWATKFVGKAMLGRALSKRKEDDDEDEARRREGRPRIGPSIVNLSSLLAVQGGVGSAAYAASKAGVLGLTRALAAELGPSGIRVNAIVPGYIETDMTAAMQPAAREKALERIPLKRFGDVDEIADAAVFLASNQYANNCVLNLDGGLSAI